MNNSFLLFDTITTFQKKQREAFDEYKRTMSELDKYKGSQHYTDAQKAAMDKRRASEEAARKDARYWTQKALEQMQAANRVRKMEAPTAEQVAILQAMKMRTDISEAELEQIANSMNGNALAIGVINDFARELYKKKENTGAPNAALKHAYATPPNFSDKVKGNYGIPEMETALRDIASTCTRIINSDGANRVRGMAADLHNAVHGTSIDRDSLAREEIAASEPDFYGSISSVPYEIITKCVND